MDERANGDELGGEVLASRASPAGGLGRAQRRRAVLRLQAKRGLFAAAGMLPSPLRSRSAGTVVLYYHSLDDDERRGVPPARFEQQVAYLARHFHLVRLCDLRSGTVPEGRPAACITFDDGYLDNAELGAPILAKYQAPATFFLISDLLGGSFRRSSGEYRIMTAQHARQLAGAGHEIGSHTARHPRLATLSPASARQEILDGRAALEDALGAPVRSFAFPYGNQNAAVRHMVRDAGFECAATTRPGFISPDQDWYAVPRVPVSGQTRMAQFRGQLTAALRLAARFSGGASD